MIMLLLLYHPCWFYCQISIQLIHCLRITLSNSLFLPLLSSRPRKLVSNFKVGDNLSCVVVFYQLSSVMVQIVCGGNAGLGGKLLIRGTRNGKQKIIGNEVTNGDRVKSVFFFPCLILPFPLFPLFPLFSVLVPCCRSPFPFPVFRFSDIRSWMD